MHVEGGHICLSTLRAQKSICYRSKKQAEEFIKDASSEPGFVLWRWITTGSLQEQESNANSGFVEEICEILVKGECSCCSRWKCMEESREYELKEPGGCRAVPPTQTNTCAPSSLHPLCLAINNSLEPQKFCSPRVIVEDRGNYFIHFPHFWESSLFWFYCSGGLQLGQNTVYWQKYSHH